MCLGNWIQVTGFAWETLLNADPFWRSQVAILKMELGTNKLAQWFKALLPNLKTQVPHPGSKVQRLQGGRTEPTPASCPLSPQTQPGEQHPPWQNKYTHTYIIKLFKWGYFCFDKALLYKTDLEIVMSCACITDILPPRLSLKVVFNSHHLLNWNVADVCMHCKYAGDWAQIQHLLCLWATPQANWHHP